MGNLKKKKKKKGVKTPEESVKGTKKLKSTKKTDEKSKIPAKKSKVKSTKKAKSTKTTKTAKNTEKAEGARHSNKPKAIRLSMRIAKKVTSITLNPNIVGLWLVFCTEADPSDQDLLKMRVNEFVGRCMKKWDREDGKGLSEYIGNRMIKACLDENDFKMYKKYISTLTSK